MFVSAAADRLTVDCPQFGEGSKGYLFRDYQEFPLFSVGRAWPGLVIPRVEWRDRAEELERSESRGSDLMRRAGIRCKDQDGTNYCWGFGVVSAVEQARCLANEPYVELSPASVCGPITRYRNNGGQGVWAIKYAAEHGIAPVALWPQTARDASLDTPDCRAARREFGILDWFEIGGSLGLLMTLLLLRFPVALGVNRWSHLIVALDCVPLDGADRYAVGCRNSWGPSYGVDGFFNLGLDMLRGGFDGCAPAVPGILV